MSNPTNGKKAPKLSLKQIKFYSLIAFMAAGDIGFVRLFAERFSQVKDVQVLLYIVTVMLMAFIVREVCANK